MSNGTTFRKVIPDVVTGLSANGHYSSASLDIFWKVGGALQADPFTLDTAVPADELEKLEDFQAALPSMQALPPNSPIIVKLGAPLASPPAQRQFWRLSLSVTDTDNDGTPDNGEFDGGYSTNPYSSDTDGDLLTDAVEIAGGTNPAGNDSDNDGIPDNDEVTLESETQSKSLFKQGFSSFATTSPPRKFLWKTTTWNPNYIGSIVPFDPDIIEPGGRNTFVNQLNGQEFSFPVAGLFGSLNYQPVTIVGTPTATTRNSAMPWSAPGWDFLLNAPGTLIGAATGTEVLTIEYTTPFLKSNTLSNMTAFTGDFTSSPKESVHVLSTDELNYSASKMQYRWKFAGPAANTRSLVWSETFTPDNPNDPGLAGVPADQIRTVKSYTGTATQTGNFTVSVGERFPNVNGKIAVENLPFEVVSRDKFLAGSFEIPEGWDTLEMEFVGPGGENLGKYGHLLGGGSTKIYNAVTEILGEEDVNSGGQPGTQKVWFVKDPDNARKINFYTCFNSVGSAEIKLYLNGSSTASGGIPHELTAAQDFADTIEYVDAWVKGSSFYLPDPTPPPGLMAAPLATAQSQSASEEGGINNLTRACLIPFFNVINQVEGLSSVSIGLLDGVRNGVQDDWAFIQLIAQAGVAAGDYTYLQAATELETWKSNPLKRASELKQLADKVCEGFVFEPLQELQADLSTWEGFQKRSWKTWNRYQSGAQAAWTVGRGAWSGIVDGMTEWADDFCLRMMTGSEQVHWNEVPWAKDSLLSEINAETRLRCYTFGKTGVLVDRGWL